MTSDDDTDARGESARRVSVSNKGKPAPGWANGLRELYDSVVEEDIPNSFKDLLSKLDEKD
ncbi:MAG: NepR family anti-sigma factor [Qipengyuania sp.]